MSIRGIGLIQLRIGIIGNPCECAIEPPGSISHGVCLLVKMLHVPVSWTHGLRLLLWPVNMGDSTSSMHEGEINNLRLIYGAGANPEILEI